MHAPRCGEAQSALDGPPCPPAPGGAPRPHRTPPGGRRVPLVVDLCARCTGRPAVDLETCALAPRPGYRRQLAGATGGTDPARSDYREQQIHRSDRDRALSRSCAFRALRAGSPRRLRETTARGCVRHLASMVERQSFSWRADSRRGRVIGRCSHRSRGLPNPGRSGLRAGPSAPTRKPTFATCTTSPRRRGIAGRVRFLGERRDVAACMHAADIHCQPNTAPEPFGLVFVEALYAGLPVVTTAPWRCAGNTDRRLRCVRARRR